MTDLTERSVIERITIQADGTIEVQRVTLVLRGGDVFATSAPAIQVLDPQQDLAALELEPIVLRVLDAAWSDEQLQAAHSRVLASMQAHHDTLQQKETEALDALNKQIEKRKVLETQHQQAIDELAAAHKGLARSREALMAAHGELDAEHATLAERHEQITSARASLFALHDTIRKQRPELDALLKDRAAALPAPVALGGKRG